VGRRLVSQERAAADTAGTRSLTLRLPLPPRALSPNGSHGHWRVHATAARQYRLRCRLTALAELASRDLDAPRFGRARISYRYVCCGRGLRDPRCTPQEHRSPCLCDYQPRDADNAFAACAKRAQDGLVDAGVLVADDAAHCALGGFALLRHRQPCHCGGYVEVTIEEVAA